MTRDHLEAVVRRSLTDIVIAVVRDEADTKLLNKLTDAILAAHDAAVGAALGEIDNYRRNKPPVVHWRDDFNVPACRRDGRMIDPVLSDSQRQVNCGACRRTRSFKEAP